MSFTFSNEDDEDFGAISNSSSLASIFQDSSSGIQATSKSLVYTAPKQPLNKKQAGSHHPLPKGVLAISPVTAYKLINEKYEPIPGKMGFALLCSHESKNNIFNLILYQNKQKPIAAIKISPEFTLTSQPDNFCTFYDNQRQNWAVLFDSKDACQNFFYEIEQVKMLLSPKTPVPIKETPSNDKMDGTAVAFNSSVKENSDKTTLINRIAKLGQPILPLSGPIVADDSDSEQIINSSPEPESQRTKPKIFPRPVISKSPIPSKPEENCMLNSMAVSSQMFNPWNNQSTYPMLQYLPANFSSAAVPNSNNHFDTLLSEYRTQNSEIRMHLVRLTDKIDILLQKNGNENHSSKAITKSSEEFQNEIITHLHNLQIQSNGHSIKLDKVREDINSIIGQASNKLISPSGEAEMIAKERAVWTSSQKEANATIQQLEEEITRLKTLLNDASEKEQDFNLQQLMDENARLQTMIISASKENEVSYQELREENTRLKAQLEISSGKTKNLILELEAKLETYQSKCAQAESSLNQLKCLVSEKDEQISQFQQQVQMLEAKSLQAHSLADALQRRLDDVKTVRHNISVTELIPVEEQVKTIMNKVYKETMKQFRPEQSYSLKSIKSTLSTVIRDVTLAMLQCETSAKSAEVPLQPESSNVLTLVEPVTNTGPAGPVSLLRVHEEKDDSLMILSSEDLKKGNLPEDTIVDPDLKKERSVSFLETLHSSLAAAESHRDEQIWKPDPPPPPLFDDDDDEWLA